VSSLQFDGEPTDQTHLAAHRAQHAGIPSVVIKYILKVTKKCWQGWPKAGRSTAIRFEPKHPKDQKLKIGIIIPGG
jgi:hypothetical protein